jgi:phosphoglycerate dehydrogenase-like enzyme
MRIALFDLARTQKDKLRALLPASDEFVDLAELATAPVDVDVLIASRFAESDASRVRFRLLQAPGAGVDKIAMHAIPQSAWICNVYEHEGPIAEYVFSAMLEATVNFSALARQIPEKGWAGAYFSRQPHGELAGKTVGIVGLGHIGSAVARRAKAFDMRVMAVAARKRDSAPDVDWIATPDKLGELLDQSDFVVLAAPLNDATRGAIDASGLARMKNTAILINIARAEIVVEQDLYEALRDGRIGGAVLDPWYAYPASIDDSQARPSRLPFETLPNVRMTAHSAAWTNGVWERRCPVFAKNIELLRSGKTPINVVRGSAASHSKE